MDLLRRKGVKALKEMFSEVTEDEELCLQQRISLLTDYTEKYRIQMRDLLRCD